MQDIYIPSYKNCRRINSPSCNFAKLDSSYKKLLTEAFVSFSQDQEFVAELPPLDLLLVLLEQLLGPHRRILHILPPLRENSHLDELPQLPLFDPDQVKDTEKQDSYC